MSKPFPEQDVRPSPEDGKIEDGTVCEFGPFRLDLGDGALTRNGDLVPLPPRVASVLGCLVGRAGRIVSRQELVDAAWGQSFVGYTSLAEAISLARQALGDDSQKPRFIQTIPRRGYRFVAAVRVVEGESPGSSMAEKLGPSGESRPSKSPEGLRGRRLWRAGVTLLGGAAAAVLLVRLGPDNIRRSGEGGRTGAAPRSPVRVEVAIPPGQRILPGSRPAWTPDAKNVVWSGQRDGVSTLWVRSLAEYSPRELPGTEGAWMPFVSPDGRWVAFFTEGGRLCRTPFEGGPVLTVAPFLKAVGGTWLDDENIVVSDWTGGLVLYPSAGGEPRELLVPEPEGGDYAYWWPSALPGGEAIVFDVVPVGAASPRIDLLVVETGERRTLLQGASHPLWSAGHLLFVREAGVFAAPFDAQRLELGPGPERALLDEVSIDPWLGLAGVAAAPDGSLAYIPGDGTAATRRTFSIWEDGVLAETSLPEGPFRNLVVEPGGRRVVVTRREGPRSELWVLDLMGGTSRQLTYDAFDIEPDWRPDGRIVFARSRRGPLGIWEILADGSSPATLLSAETTAHRVPEGTGPGLHGLIVSRLDPGNAWDLWWLAEREAELRPVLESEEELVSVEVSPKGEWLALIIASDGFRLEVRPLLRGENGPEVGASRWRLSSERARDPAWSVDGRTLGWREGERFLVVEVDPRDGELRPGPARELFRADDLQMVRGLPDGRWIALHGGSRPGVGAIRVELGTLVSPVGAASGAVVP